VTNSNRAIMIRVAIMLCLDPVIQGFKVGV
jgi:hypothetical protein